MKPNFIHIPLVLALTAAPAFAQDDVAPDTERKPADELTEGLEKLRDGSRMLLEKLFAQMGPALEELEGLVDDMTLYEAPEVLENGDIIIRRKPDAPDLEAPEPDEDAMPEDESPEGGLEL